MRRRFGLKNLYFQFMAWMRSQLRFCDLACHNRALYSQSNSLKQAKVLKQPETAGY